MSNDSFTSVPVTQVNNSLRRHRFSIAICVAERGFGELYSGFLKRNNPGDLKGTDGILDVYPTSDDGWSALRNQIDLIYSDRSKYYNVQMTIREMATTWTGNDNPAAWSAIVAGMLGVSEDTKLCDIP